MKIVQVEWYDAFAMGVNDWFSPQEVEEKIPADKRGELCTTIGYLYRNATDHVLIVQTYQPESPDKDDSSLNGVMFIPRGMITKITEILYDKGN